MVQLNKNKCLIIDKKRGKLISTVKIASNKVFPLIITLKKKYSLNYENVDGSYNIPA